MRAVHLFAAGFLLASAEFLTTMLIAPSTSEASINPAAVRTEAPAMCDVLPSGDIATCTIPN
ncbi:hypothetical protein [uncultured Methylobacterium sp.]|uniref:hypothetical protein n=1 Tax=uncultured Methylobacterium sp. TaxID=157278 RepID=UPI0035CB4FC4